MSREREQMERMNGERERMERENRWRERTDGEWMERENRWSVTAVGRSGGPRCRVVRVHDVYYNLNTETKVDQTAPVLLGTHTTQKTTTHKTQVGKGYLSMVLNQRQRPTAVWEPYQAKNKEMQKHRKNNIERPPLVTPWPNQHRE